MTVGPSESYPVALPVTTATANHRGVMERERRLFEELWLYRQMYAQRGPYDRQPVLGLAEAIRYADDLFRWCATTDAPARGAFRHEASADG